eukprot:11976806-Prorocentrum_lima.AAC.1
MKAGKDTIKEQVGLLERSGHRRLSGKTRAALSKRVGFSLWKQASSNIKQGFIDLAAGKLADDCK